MNKIDVSECKHYKNKNCIADYLLTDMNFSEAKCELNPNCYYKQLKRKEQECEKKSWEIGNLGYKIKNQRKEINIRLEQLDQLKAENEQLKEELSVIQHNCNREGCKYYDDNTFKVFYECKAQKALQLSANSVTTKYCDLLKTLTEIKEIMKKHCRKCKKHKFYHFQLCCTCKYTDILQKISECEVMDE